MATAGYSENKSGMEANPGVSPHVAHSGRYAAASDPRLFGRDREWRALEDLIDRLQVRGAALVVRGEAGIGKSSLLAAAIDEARARGHQVLLTAGVQCETNLPFAGLHHLLSPILDQINSLAGVRYATARSPLMHRPLAPNPIPRCNGLLGLTGVT